jgi:selenide,water dikinase
MGGGAVPPIRDLVLLGGGHSHVQVLKAFGMRPLPGVRLTVVCREPLTPYSGMLPGHVAGCYDWREIHIDLGPLTQFAGARLIADEVVGLEPERQRVHLLAHPSLRYDLLSINTGAVPEQPVPGGIPVKPIGQFLPHWQAVRDQVQPGTRVGLVGGGVGGVELALAMRRALPPQTRIKLFTDQLLSGSPIRLQTRVLAALARAGVELARNFRVADAGPGYVRAADGRTEAVDHLFWVTGGTAPDWPRQAGLGTDAHGFVRVDRYLCSTTHPEIFAAGDVAALEGQPRPKAGVFAVRAGVVLAENLRRALLGKPLRPFRAQRRFLALIGTGDGRAIASRGRWVAEGAWVWRWKDWIDRRFVARFSGLDSAHAAMAAGRAARAAVPADFRQEIPARERCGGCGAKIAADPLRRVLARLPDQSRPEVAVGIGDDAAVLTVPGGRLLITVDGFRSLIDDPYRFGRITAHHSLNDILAMGGRGTAALAMATVPLMAEALMEEDLYWLLRGAVDVLNAHGVPLVGGHSTEGAELSLALTVTGSEAGRILSKAGLMVGDRLLLTKALGTGVLLAGYMQGRARTDAVELALASMDRSNAAALEILLAHDVTALTDVTGFGLLGHLAEMLRASGVGVELPAAAVPVLPGALALLEAGVVTSLDAGNRQVLADFEIDIRLAAGARLGLLVDPQTSGGLLAGIPAHRVQSCLSALQAAGYQEATVIGTVARSAWRILPAV